MLWFCINCGLSVKYARRQRGNNAITFIGKMLLSLPPPSASNTRRVVAKQQTRAITLPTFSRWEGRVVVEWSGLFLTATATAAAGRWLSIVLSGLL